MSRYPTGCLGICLIFLFSAIPVIVPASQTAGEGTPYFTNKDIEKYGRPADEPEAATEAAKPPRKTGKSGDAAQDKEKERWCKRASSARKTIEKRQDAIDEIEKEIADRREKGLVGGKAETSLRKKLMKARREHGYAEKGLGEIEDEAYRKGIPAGWLRCQFE